MEIPITFLLLCEEFIITEIIIYPVKVINISLIQHCREEQYFHLQLETNFHLNFQVKIDVNAT